MKPFVRVSICQLFIMLYISRMVVNATYSSFGSNTNHLYYGFVAALLALPATALMVLPVYGAFVTSNGRTITDNGYDVFKKYGAVIAVVYGLYFLWVLINTLSRFNIMVTKVLNPSASVFVLSVAVVAASMYGAYKGIEALGRASTIIFVFIAIALIILFCTLLPKADTLNFIPVSADNTGEIIDIILNMLAINSCIPAMAILLPFAKGDCKKGIGIWIAGVYISTAVITAIIIAVMGDYLKTQIFPVYAVTAIASLGVAERLDGLFLGVWTAGMFVKVSLFIYLLSACVKRVFGEVISRWSVLICGVVVFVSSTVISMTDGMFDLLNNNSIMLVFTMLTAVVIPIILIVANKITNR